MEENIIRGIINDCETGESWSVEHCLLVIEAELSAIVRVLKVESYEIPEDGSMQISLDCQALDSIGSVFDLDVSFSPKTVSERDQILRDLKGDSILLMHGRYLSIGNRPKGIQKKNGKPGIMQREIKGGSRNVETK